MNKLLLAGVVTVATTIGASNNALSWGLSDLDPTNKNSTLRKGIKDLDPTNPNGSMGKDLHAKIRLCNRASVTVNYSMGTRQGSLRDGRCTNWKITGQGVLSFDREFREGYQGKTYRLNDGHYNFVKAKWPIANFNAHMAGIDIRRQ